MHNNCRAGPEKAKNQFKNVPPHKTQVLFSKLSLIIIKAYFIKNDNNNKAPDLCLFNSEGNIVFLLLRL